MSNPKEHAHALLDMLPEEKLTAVVGLLEVMVEPLSRSLASAPMEEEEITPDTAAALSAPALPSLAGKAFPTKICSASSVHESDRPDARESPSSGHPRPAPISAPLTAPPPWRFSTAWIATWLTVPAR